MVLFCEVFKLIVHCKNIHIFERSPFTVRAVIMELRGQCSYSDNIKTQIKKEKKEKLPLCPQDQKCRCFIIFLHCSTRNYSWLEIQRSFLNTSRSSRNFMYALRTYLPGPWQLFDSDVISRCRISFRQNEDTKLSETFVCLCGFFQNWAKVNLNLSGFKVCCGQRCLLTVFKTVRLSIHYYFLRRIPS